MSNAAKTDRLQRSGYYAAARLAGRKIDLRFWLGDGIKRPKHELIVQLTTTIGCETYCAEYTTAVETIELHGVGIGDLFGLAVEKLRGAVDEYEGPTAE